MLVARIQVDTNQEDFPLQRSLVAYTIRLRRRKRGEIYLRAKGRRSPRFLRRFRRPFLLFRRGMTDVASLKVSRKHFLCIN